MTTRGRVVAMLTRPTSPPVKESRACGGSPERRTRPRQDQELRDVRGDVARRLFRLQQIDGYDATIVSGVVTQREGTATGARPGRLVRGARNSPQQFGAAAG